MCRKTVKRWKPAMCPLKTGADASVWDLKKEEIVDKRIVVASSTLSMKERTALHKIVIAMATLYSIFNINFKNLAAKH